ncbi:hypothetical protein [Pseudotabrizicola sp. 4114]|uniref:hypothetical protein n=1 Tax=Pseudotabrizicola sp. 4114 TaxID=2817731 RepID=UPI00286482F8|nr:hypothetical protein [Pseudorhodobacter sp. 4114]
MTAPSADITIHAAYASVVEDDEDGFLFIGFAQGEEEDEPYALFRQPLTGGPVWFAVNDEDFGAEDAVQSITRDARGLTIAIRPEHVASFGWAAVIAIRIGPQTEDADQALAALHDMIGDSFPL